MVGIVLLIGGPLVKAGNRILRFRVKSVMQTKLSLSQESQSVEWVILISGYSYFMTITMSLIKIEHCSKSSFIFIAPCKYIEKLSV